MSDRAHLPLTVVVASNLMDLSRIEAAANRSGYRMERRRSDDLAEGDPIVAFVDLEAAEADAAIVALAERGVRVVAYGPHVDDLAMIRARTLGAEIAEPRSRVFRDPAAYLPPLV